MGLLKTQNAKKGSKQACLLDDSALLSLKMRVSRYISDHLRFQSNRS
jgi:hypothetical protein